MTRSTHMWVVTEDPQMAQRIQAALPAVGAGVTPGVCPGLKELAAKLEEFPASAALIDIDQQPAQLLRGIEPLVNRFEHSRFLVLATSESRELMLEAMQAGARHFVTKAGLEAELAGVIQKLRCNGWGRPSQRGQVIAVFSAAGGCGATTLAVNLADELRELCGSPTLLIDLDTAYGAVASYLGIESRYGIADIMSSAREVDAQLISSTAVPFGESLHVLVSPVSAQSPEAAPLAWDHLASALECCKQAYEWTVIDAPRLPIKATAELAALAHQSLIVHRLSVKDVRFAAALRHALVRRAVPAETIRFIAGRHHRRTSMVTIEDAADALAGVTPMTVCDDSRTADESITFGKLLSQAARRSALRRDIQRLAEHLGQRQPRLNGSAVH